METAAHPGGHRTVDTERLDRVLRAAVAAGLVGDEEVAAGFVDVDGLLRSVADLHAAFAAHGGAEGGAVGGVEVLHTFAAKACALVPVLSLLAGTGIGCEVASAGELALALAAGFPAERIVLDSPAKTEAELAQALALGVAVNADNLDEVEVIAALRGPAPSGTGPVLGLRINPQVGAGSIGAMSTASQYSKFGEPLRDPGARERITAAFARHPWLTRLHVHVGSQGCPLELIAAGVRAVYELAEEINERAGRRQVTSMDLGGGLTVNFEGDEIRPSHRAYADHLREAVPGLFDGRYALVTEFGRSLVAKNGFTVAVAEYTKQVGGRRVVLTHAGAHLATRTVFMPEAWPLRVSVHRPDGSRRVPGPDGPPVVQDIAGPLCFAGDVVAHERPLPAIEPGDLVVLHDTGGYYASAPWGYNSVARPAVHGFTTAPDGRVRFAVVRDRQSVEQIVAESGGAHVGSLLGLRVVGTETGH